MIDQANRLRALMQQQNEQPAPAPHAGPRIIVVTGGKGGVGTTTVALNLAVTMTRQCDRVALVDADPDRADVATLCGLQANHDLADLACARRPLEEALTAGPEGIFVVAGAANTSAFKTPPERFHSQWIEAVGGADEPFDYVVVDAGNGSTESVRVLWRIADLVLLVTTAELPSIMDAYASMKTLADRDAPPAIHTLVNRIDEPALAYDVHGRLARAAWRFLGFHLDSAGHVAVGHEAAASGASVLSPAQPQSAPARDFGQVARTLRTALNDTASRFWAARTAEAPTDEEKEAVACSAGDNENSICTLAGNEEKREL
jgi:flagellar biosynthesis protein FlhG